MALLYSPEGKPLFSTMESELEAIDRAIARLNEQKQVWATLPVGKKITYLQRMLTLTEEMAERWVAAATKAKGIPESSSLVGEEWISGPTQA